VGRGCDFVLGTLLAATAAKLSRPFGISRAEDAMVAISMEDALARFSAAMRHFIS
jgi:hypothetical protein